MAWVNHGRRFNPLEKIGLAQAESIQFENHGTQDATERIHDPTGPYRTHNPLGGIRQGPRNRSWESGPLVLLRGCDRKDLASILGKFKVCYTDYGPQPGEPPLRPTYLSCGGTTVSHFND
jgi:hypothetical protein